jgi:hypothetical protein
VACIAALGFFFADVITGVMGSMRLDGLKRPPQRKMIYKSAIRNVLRVTAKPAATDAFSGLRFVCCFFGIFNRNVETGRVNLPYRFFGFVNFEVKGV